MAGAGPTFISPLSVKKDAARKIYGSNFYKRIMPFKKKV